MRNEALMANDEIGTDLMNPQRAWEIVWKELARVGISAGQDGPASGSIQWGKNAERAIKGLQISSLSAGDISYLGMLLQAVIHAAEIKGQENR